MGKELVATLVRPIVAIAYLVLGIASIGVLVNFRGVTAILARKLSKEPTAWGLSSEGLRWYAAQVAFACAAVAGFGLNFPPLAFIGLVGFVPTLLIAWTLGFVRGVRGRQLFTFPGRLPEVVSWALVLALLIGGIALAKPPT